MVNANDTEWLAEQAALARPAVIADAKANPNTFIPFIMRDEESGAPIEQTEDHEEWHNLINTHDRVIHFPSAKSIAMASIPYLGSIFRFKVVANGLTGTSG